MSMADLLLDRHNPDVLTCIANLSNDEVFTPPEMAGAMLDLVAEAWAKDHDGANLWANPNVRVLDPVVKTGVFLREATRRFNEGLASVIPDPQERVNHILTQQIYGIAITELTALMARRSVYCSKRADGEHSICTVFDTPDGNIWFERTEHTWTGGTRESRVDPLTGDEIFIYTGRKCSYCGAGENDYGRGDDLETHAYAFIHTDDIKQRINEIFGAAMHFDIVIGNPPYQLSDGGFGKSAAPIYHEFVEQAKALDPRYLTMIIPSRWFSGGKGLDDFRDAMLNDDRLRSITDYLNASDVFAGIGLKGGVCYFLWNRDNRGECTVTTHFKDHDPSVATRPLLETGADTFIRFNQGVTILRKVLSAEPDPDFASLVSARKPFGLTTTFQGKSKPSGDDSVLVYQNGGTGYAERKAVPAGEHLIDCWKIFIGRAAPGTGNRDTYPHRIVSTPFLGRPGEISSETYLCIGPFDSESQAQSALSYLRCRFTRFLILLHKASQDTTRKVYSFVPQQSWDRAWTDEELYTKYGLTDEEIAFIESVVRPMEDD
ncbi:MAG: Eco57I restriction-modification methylase domain-containing protein [Rothia sp. (in: high G+C Gram-positive bacteria)]|uniref:Eco57I restriction-modification methylase domain-containing protein n=1 Tax=Rothia sp. (in: high G+C Gram-positive bacteria) TaxID=1885016 RepID=UPI0026DC4673|nr:Eco57I restriction-modification methylase domain-containing protein [Rothia sp. (in: high G+C Gram-positive bacteria)]MDO4885114.1 Eco57I restriction-modification methylase domain-containing protein [Rothia sp. (in: high G+C Gram-positive bacteria)]